MFRPMEKLIGASEEIYHLESLVKELLKEPSLEGKCTLLKESHRASQLLSEELAPELELLSGFDRYLCLALLASGQEHVLACRFDGSPAWRVRLGRLLAELKEVELFYAPIGGLVGYQLEVLKLIGSRGPFSEEVRCLSPISPALEEELSLALRGVEALPFSIEIYPSGGAGDRLDLRDEKSGEALPAAFLPFLGQTLLTGLVRDLQAREYLFYKLFGERISVPLVIMTSKEKKNHRRMLELAEENGWWGRSRKDVEFLIQPNVPVVTEKGEWILSAPQQLVTKPGGHGVLWKLLLDSPRVQSWMKEGKSHALLRQINNPLAGLDCNLLKLLGKGVRDRSSFGFLSCQRRVHAPEGMNVLLERCLEGQCEYCLTNIEYTDLKKWGLEDVPVSEGSSYSEFPCNTNILYANLLDIAEVARRDFLPGKLINMKHLYSSLRPSGEREKVRGGRLETTMQNIADLFVDRFKGPISASDYGSLKNFLLFQERGKTISTIKKRYEAKSKGLDTPESCFYDLMRSSCSLFESCCGFRVPSFCSFEEYLERGPSALIAFHPALGPLWRLIGQKIRGGALLEDAELQLEISDLDAESLTVEGSLLVLCDAVMGRTGPEGLLEYGRETGKCTLKRVSVKNRGLDRSKKQAWWKNCFERRESLKIILHGDAEFVAEDVLFEGDLLFEVEEGYRLTVSQKGGELSLLKERIEKPSWHWELNRALELKRVSTK